MTKQEFLNGKEFTYRNNTYKCEGTSLTRLHYYEGEILGEDYECDIESIGSKYFNFYTFVMGRRVSGKINFLEL